MKKIYSFLLFILSLNTQYISGQNPTLMHNFYGTPDLTNSVSFFRGVGYLPNAKFNENPRVSPRIYGTSAIVKSWKSSSSIQFGEPSTFTYYSQFNVPAGNNYYTTVNEFLTQGNYYIFKLASLESSDQEGILMEFDHKIGYPYVINANLLSRKTTVNKQVKISIQLETPIAKGQYYYIKYRHSGDPIGVFQWGQFNFPIADAKFGSFTIPGFSTIGTVNYEVVSKCRSIASFSDKAYENSIYDTDNDINSFKGSYSIVDNVNSEIQTQFSVNMSGQTVSPEGVFLQIDLNNVIFPLTNMGNNIYSATIGLEAGKDYGYRFINGGIGLEVVPNSCSPNGLTRRFTPTQTSPSPALVCFSSCNSSCSPMYDVKFRVNTTGQVVGLNGMKLAGSFNNFSTSANQMTNIGNNIYEATVSIIAGTTISYKFVNDTNFEIVPNSCGANDGNGNFNRSYVVPSSNSTLPTVCFNQCTNTCNVAPASSNVTFRVNMADQTVGSSGVKLAGSFNNFSTTANPMTNVGNNIYEATVNIATGTSITYKFVNGTNFEIVPNTCTVNDGNGNFNRSLLVPNTDIVIPTVCFNFCNNVCTTFNNVTFQVNMSGQTISPLGVKLAGSFNGFSITANPMTNIGNNIYQATLSLASNTNFTYKFVNGTNFENVPVSCSENDGNGNFNRSIATTKTNINVPVVCFSTCSNCSIIQVTFLVDMSKTVVSSKGVFLAGAFNNFSTTANPMTAIGNSVYSSKVNLPSGSEQIYKYVNGTDFELIPFDCGLLGSQTVYDRVLTVPNQNEQLDSVCFGSCNSCLTLSNKQFIQKSLNVYPNPTRANELVQVNLQEDSQINLYDLTGKLLMQENHTAGKVMFRIPNIASGMYILKSNSGNTKIIVEKK